MKPTSRNISDLSDRLEEVRSGLFLLGMGLAYASESGGLTAQAMEAARFSVMGAERALIEVIALVDSIECMKEAMPD